MTLKQPDTEELVEFVPQVMSPGRISDEIEQILCERYAKQVKVEAPCFRTGHQWRLTAKGWAGYLPVTQDFSLRLLPKVEIGNLFRMLEYAYRLKSFQFLNDLIGCQALEDYYERLANVFAKRVLDRGRKGFYRDYLSQQDRLPYVRGRLNVLQAARKPWDTRLNCHYHEHTTDLEENQILAWTLWNIARQGICTERVLPTVRKAYRSLQGLTSLHSFTPAQCSGRRYHRLNQDYHPLHSLCRFFLEQAGPSHRDGDRLIMPFLVNMESLFEMFVAEWLRAHLPSRWMVKAQERVVIGTENDLHYDIDLVVYDSETGDIALVLDTKYKVPDQPATQDIEQMEAYAHAKQCPEAVLIYPQALRHPLDVRIHDIRLRSLTFALDGDLEEAGERFQKDLWPDDPKLRGLLEAKPETNNHGCWL